MQVGLRAVLAFACVHAASRSVNAETCGQFVDVITAPSRKIGGHSCDSDRDGALKDSKYCRCDDCSIHPESCDRKGDRAFCRCDSSRQHCAPRACVAAGRCSASDATSYRWTIDCNDYNAARFPGNCEICADRVDDDCDGSTTDCSTNADGDQDGFSPPADCNDANANAHPGATEVACNAVDEDCSGADLCESNPTDPDGDGFSAPADCNEGDAAVHPGAPDACGDHMNSDCDAEGLDCMEDRDGDGFVASADCDDRNPAIHPGATDLCGDGIDQDCASGDRACRNDRDRDGYDDIAVGGDDCNDLDSSIHPGSRERCGDRIDQDCEGGDVDCATADRDGDGYIARAFGGDDCDDEDDSVYPSAPELCGDNVDSNCDGQPDPSCRDDMDRDQDGFEAHSLGGADCNDWDSRISPSAHDICGDGVDNDCNGVADDACAPRTDDATRFSDFVTPRPSRCACESPSKPSHPTLALFAAWAMVARRWRRH